MKKFMKSLLLPMMSVVVISLAATGCTDDGTKTNEEQTENTDAKDEADDVVKDTEDKVRDTNYEDIKITPDQAFDKFMELHPDTKINQIDLDKGLMEYQYVVEGYDTENAYEVKINPVDGSVISDDEETIKPEDGNGEITKDHLAKIESIIEKAKAEDASDSELDEWNISTEDGKAVMVVEIGLKKFTYDMDSEELLSTDANEDEDAKDNKDNKDSGFTDIDDKDDNTKSAINNVVSKGIMAGKTDTEFKPDELITREDVAVMMVKSVSELDKDAKTTFTDVKEDNENYGYIATSEKENIFMGFPEDLFKGSENITKQGFISVVSRALHESKDTTYPEDSSQDIKFSDKGEISDFAVKEVGMATNEGLIDNKDEELDPLANVTRAEAAVIINKLIEKIK